MRRPPPPPDRPRAEPVRPEYRREPATPAAGGAVAPTAPSAPVPATADDGGGDGGGAVLDGPFPTADESDAEPRPREPAFAVTGRGLTTILEAIVIALVSRVVLAGVVWLSLRAFPRFERYPGQLPDAFFPVHPALDGWARWDAAHYVAIAGQGYGEPHPSPAGGAGFFPLFPLLMRGAVALVGAEPTPAALALAGLVLANACFLIAVPLLARLAAGRGGERAGRNAALLLCVAPFGFFFNAAYSESLFLLLTLLAVGFGERGRWGWAGVAAGLASGTRLVGLALLPALLWRARRRGARGRDLAGIALLSPLGTIAYAAYCARVFDDPFAYFRAQATWGGWDEHVRFYAELFARQPREALGGDPRHLIVLLNLGVALVGLALLPRVWRTLDPAVALFTVLLVVVQTAATWVSLGRYLLPACGLYLAAGALLARPRWAGWPRDLVLLSSALLLALLAVLYAHGFWVV